MTTDSLRHRTTLDTAHHQARLVRILVVVATISTILINLLSNLTPL